MTPSEKPELAKPASDAQLSFIDSLIADRQLSVETIKQMRTKLDQGLSSRLASEWITWLKSQPRAIHAPLRNNAIEFTVCEMDNGVSGVNVGARGFVPAGRYALETPGPEHKNDITFLQLWIGSRGNAWRLYVQASDENYALSRTAAERDLTRIAEMGPEKSAALYGHHIGRCGICGRTLTNDESRARGIGPVCASRVGW